MVVENISISVKTTGAESAATKINALSLALERLQVTAQSTQGATQGVSSAMKSIAPAGNAASTAAQSAAKGIDRVAKSAQKSSKHTSAFGASLMRIAKYRLFRTIIKEITQAFTDGLKNVYAWSKAVGGDLAKALDSVKASGSKLKNQLGAALGELLQTAMPIINALISALTALAQVLSQLFAAFGGRGTYTVANVKNNAAVAIANDAAESWKEATKEVSNYKNTVLGFDVLNKLNDENKGGGGGSDIGTFEIKELSEWASQLKQDIDDIKTAFKEWWEDPSFENFVKLFREVSQLVTDITTTINTFTFDTVLIPAGKLLDTIFATFGLEMNFEETMKNLKDDLNTLFKKVQEFIDNPSMDSAKEVFIAISAIILDIIFGKSKDLTPQDIAKGVVKFLLGAGLGFLGGSLFGVPGAAIGYSIGAALAATFNKFTFDADPNLSQEEIASLIVSGLMATALAVTGAIFAGPGGAILGFSIGAILSVSINKFVFGDEDNTLGKEDLDRGLFTYLGIVMPYVVINLVVALKLIENWGTIKSTINKKLEELKQEIPKKVEEITTETNKKWEKFKGDVEYTFNDMLPFFERTWNDISTWCDTNIPIIADNIVGFFDDLPSNVGYVLGLAYDKFEPWFHDTTEWVDENVPQICDGITSYFEELPGKIKAQWDLVNGKFDEWYTEISTWITTNVAQVRDDIVSFFEELPGKVKTEWENVTGKFAEWKTNIGTWIETELPGVIDDIVGFFASLPGKLYTIGTEMIPELVRGISEALSGAWSNISSLAQSIANKFSFGFHVGKGDAPTMVDPALAASGGMFPNDGTLFIAGEAGAEIVTNMGSGRTGVTNVEQMEAAVANGNVGVINAVYGMANMIVKAIETIDPDITLDGESLADKMYYYNQQAANRHGDMMVSMA